MKVTIAQLQQKIEYLEKEKNLWYEKYRELKDAEDKRNELEFTGHRIMKEQERQQVRNLMEIIRWQVNGRTAEAPFMPMKSERDDNGRNY